MHMPASIITRPRISTIRSIPENGTAWSGAAVSNTVTVPQSPARARVLNWTGWLILALLPVALMIWIDRGMSQNRAQMEKELQETEAREAAAVRRIGALR